MRFIFRVSAFSVMFWDEFYKIMECSPVVYPLPFFQLDRNKNCDNVVECIPTSTKKATQNLPLMSYYLDNIITFVDDDNSECIHIVQLTDGLCWKNSACVSSAA